MGEYLGILALVGLAALICGLMVTLSYLLGPKKVTPYKISTYESGVAPAGDARERFPIKFYLVAIVFILFDIEVVFLWPWISAYRNSPDTEFIVASLVTFLLYMATFVLAYAYVLRVGAIDWDEATALDPAKLGNYDEEAREGSVSVVPAEHPVVGVGGGTK